MTLPTADMPNPHEGGYTIQGLENTESSATLRPAELTPQGSSQQIPVLSSCKCRRAHQYPSSLWDGHTPTALLPAVTASAVQPPVSVPYNPLQPNQMLNLAKAGSQ